MARKRLNKKVAIIGSVVFALLIITSIAVVLYLGRNPEDFIKDGDAAWKRAREATDEQIKNEEYERALLSYARARGLAKSDDLKLNILFKLADINIEMEQWRSMLGCMNGIINLDPDNIQARHARLEYVYTVADSGGGASVWQEVNSQASDFIERIEDSDELQSAQFQWDSLEVDSSLPTAEILGSYLYVVRGRARLTLASMGATTEPDVLLDQAKEDLNKALDFEPDNVHLYWYLAQAAVTEGEILASRGNVDARNEAYQEAEKYLQQAIDKSPGDIQAHVNLLRFKHNMFLAAYVPLRRNLEQAYSMAENTEKQQIIQQLQEQIESELKPFRSELFTAVERFTDNPKLQYELFRFHQIFPRELDKALEAVDKALSADPENVSYAIQSSNLHYRKFSRDNDRTELNKALEIAEKALELPGAEETTGPRSFVKRNNRLALYFFLAGCYIEQILDPVEEQINESEKQAWLQSAEDAVHQIEQIFGSGEDPYVVLWQGMLELAKGQNNSAVRKLYGAYNQLKTSGIEGESVPRTYFRRAYSLMSYTLANHYSNSSETGAVLRFLVSAFETGISVDRPKAILDLVDHYIQFRNFGGAIIGVGIYESLYGVTSRSEQLRIRAYIEANQFEDAEKNLIAANALSEVEKNELRLSLLQARIHHLQNILDRRKVQEQIRASGFIQEETVEEASSLLASDSETEPSLIDEDANDLMVAEMGAYRQEYSQILKQYMPSLAESFDESTLRFACRNYILLNDIEAAQNLIKLFLKDKPDNFFALFYRQYLAEPEPTNIELQRRYEIQEKVVSNLSDPGERWINLAGLYMRQGNYDKARQIFNKVVQVEAWLNEQGLFERPVFNDFEPTFSQLRIAAGQLFGLAIERQDWELARKAANIARVENLDDCEGQYFYARLAFAQNDYEQALNYIESALNLRPIFSHGYMLRSMIHGDLGNNVASIEDAREAVDLSPTNPDHVRRLALVLYQRNQRLGDNNVTSEQDAETRSAFEQALALNPSDRQLLSLYAEYISDTEPSRALAIRQYLYRSNSNIENALLLGVMAMKIANSEMDESRKNVLSDIAGQAFADAYKMNPSNTRVLDTYASYYREIGQEDKAWDILEASKDQKLLWRNYYRQGRYQEAKALLEDIYKDDPTDTNSVMGLILVSREIGDTASVKENCERLISLQDNVENYLMQIQTYLGVGLVKEAELKLQSFMERFPEETRALLLQAWLMMRQGRLRDALEVANRYLETNEQSPIAWEIRGRINYLLTNYNDAINDFNRSRRLLNSPELSIYLSKACIGAERNQEAIIELQNAIENNPQVSNDARLLLAELYKKLNRKDALNRFFNETIRELPDSSFWLLNAASYAQQEGEFERASILYERALRLSEGNEQAIAFALDGYLEALISSGNYAAVFEVIPQYTNTEYAPIAFYRMAEAKLERGDRMAADDYCKKALDGSSPSDLSASGIVDKIYALLGKEVLYNYCQEGFSLRRDSERLNFIMFQLMLKDNEQLNKAIEYIDKCISMSEPDDPERLMYILKKAQVLTLAFHKTSDKIYLDKAVEEHKSLLTKMPNNTGVLNNLAYLLAESDESLSEALEYARRAYEVQPNNPSILDTYAFVLYKNDEYEQAAELAQAAIQHFEDRQMTIPAAVYEHLGMIREKLGLMKEAKDAYNRALSIGGLSGKSVDRIQSAVNKISQSNL